MKQIFGTGTRGTLVMAAPLVMAANLMMAQVPGATVMGKVTNPAGQVLTKGDVKFTKDKTGAEKDRKYLYSFPLDGSGMFKGADVAPGDYLAVVYADGKTPDFQNVTIKAGETKTIDFDMTRAEYIKGLSAEEKAALEDYKKKNASVTAENAKIGNINATLTKARADAKNGHADEAVTALQGLTAAKPDEALIWASLGDAQLAVADSAFAAAKAAKTSTSDPAITQKYTDATVSYQKAIDLNAAAKKPSPELVSASSWNMGVALDKSGKYKEASDSFDRGAQALPSSAATLYDNELATLFNLQKLDVAVPIADKAIAADPKHALNYYIKGQALIPGATVDAKTQKYILPAGCLEAYQMYLELEPNGKFAPEVTALLQGLGQPVKNSFKAGKK